MSREVKRVPVDFDWPLQEVWQGYLMPDSLGENPCPDCKNGYSSEAQYMFDMWYGYVPFGPAATGSTAFTIDTPEVRAFAERNIDTSPDFYGDGEAAIVREAQRLADLWNGQWSHHLNDDDVAALVEAGRLRDFTHRWDPEKRWQKIDPPVVPTAEQVNRWSLSGFGHDAINASVVIRARCEREGIGDTCETCGGHGSREAYEGQRAEAEAWERTEPPTGEGWQLWETVSEGSPVSQVFASAEELAQWLTTEAGGKMAGRRPMAISAAREFVKVGWAPSVIENAGGIHDGADYVGTQAVLRDIEGAGESSPDLR